MGVTSGMGQISSGLLAAEVGLRLPVHVSYVPPVPVPRPSELSVQAAATTPSMRLPVMMLPVVVMVALPNTMPVFVMS